MNLIWDKLQKWRRFSSCVSFSPFPVPALAGRDEDAGIQVVMRLAGKSGFPALVNYSTHNSPDVYNIIFWVMLYVLKPLAHLLIKVIFVLLLASRTNVSFSQDLDALQGSVFLDPLHHFQTFYLLPVQGPPPALKSTSPLFLLIAISLRSLGACPYCCTLALAHSLYSPWTPCHFSQ